MSIVKLLSRFLPNPPPQETSAQMRDYLRDELDQIANAVNGALESVDLVRSRAYMVLGGIADDFNLDTTPTKLVNYVLFGAIGDVPTEPDPATGEIICPKAGAYHISAYVYGLQPSVTQNEAIQLLIGVNGSLKVVAGLDVTSNQTEDRSLVVVLTRVFSVGDVLTMWLSATADLGTFEIQETSFEVTFVKLSDDPEDLTLNWFQ